MRSRFWKPKPNMRMLSFTVASEICPEADAAMMVFPYLVSNRKPGLKVTLQILPGRERITQKIAAIAMSLFYSFV
jgi:hypothetical protein